MQRNRISKRYLTTALSSRDNPGILYLLHKAFPNRLNDDDPISKATGIPLERVEGALNYLYSRGLLTYFYSEHLAPTDIVLTKRGHILTTSVYGKRLSPSVARMHIGVNGLSIEELRDGLRAQFSQINRFVKRGGLEGYLNSATTND